MRKLLTLALLLLAAVPSLYARERAWGFCSQGGVRVYVSNVGSSAPAPSFATTYWQQSYPNCTVTVYLTGTTTLATLYSDNSSTPLSNPFTANSNGYWRFYADDGRYDVKFSGTSAGIQTPFTTADILLCDPVTCGGGGGGLTPHNLLSSTHSDTVPYTPPVAGDQIYSLPTPGFWERFAGNTSSTRKFLTQLGNGTAVTDQSWTQIGGTCGANPVTAVNPDGSVVCGAAGITGVQVAVDDVVIGTQPTIDLKHGTNITLAGVNNTGANRVEVTITSTGGGGTGCIPAGVAGQVLYDSGTGCGQDETFIGGAPNSDVWQIQKGGIFRFQNDDAHDPASNFFELDSSSAGFLESAKTSYGNGAQWRVFDTAENPIIGTSVGFELDHTISTTGRNGIAMQIFPAYQAGANDFTAQVTGLLIQNDSTVSVGRSVNLNLKSLNNFTDTSVVNLWNEGTACSDGSIRAGCTSTNQYDWAGIVTSGKTWFGGDIQLQPEATTLPLPGTPITGGSMSQVTCTSDNRGRIHYVNSSTGVADIPEICAKTAADTYGWVAFGASYVNVPGIAPTFQSVADGSAINWNLGSNYISNGIVSLNHTTATRALNVSGMQSGGVYHLNLLQDSTGGAVLTLGSGCTWYVNNALTSTLGLATTASIAQSFSWIYDGTRCFVDTTAGGGGGGSGFAYLGAWSNSTPYVTNNIVSQTGSSYIALSNNTGVQPGTDGGVTWAVLAAAGAQGPAGTNGTNGTNGTDGAPGAPGYSPNQVIAGCGVAYSSGLTFTVSACSYIIQNATYGSAAGTATLAAADPSLDRIDAIVVNTSGAIAVVTGTPAATPAPPSIDISTQLQLTFAYVAAGASTPSNIVTTDIYHENAEWTCASTSHVNCNSSSNPHSGTKDIEWTSSVSGNNVTLTIPAGTIDLATRNNLVFWIRSKATFPSGTSIVMQWFNGATAKCTPVSLANGNFGFSSSNTTTYQQIVVPTSVFSCNGIPVTRIRFQQASSSTLTGFYLDDIILQGGVASSTGTAAMNWKGAWLNSTTYAVNDTVTYNNLTYTAIQTNTNQAPSSNPTSWAVHSFSVPGTTGNLLYNNGTNVLGALASTISGSDLTLPGSISASQFISTDTVDNTQISFLTGSSGDSTCPTPTAGQSYLCNQSNILNLSNNGGAYTPVITAGVNSRRTCMLQVGDGSTTVVSGDYSPFKVAACKIPYAATIVEIDIQTDAGTPSILLERRRGASTLADLLSGALAANGTTWVCAMASISGTCIDGTTSSGTITLSNASLNAGDVIEVKSGTASTETSARIAVVFTVN